MNKKITAIIVTYFPDNLVVSKTIKSICNQVDRVFIVDNTPNGSDFFRDGNFLGENNIELITLNENVGIARAQNIGIKKALENKTDFVLLSDQDTFYPEKYADRMLEIYFNLSNKDKVATLAPDFIVPKNGRTRGGFILFDKDSVTVIRPESGCDQISQAIASGMVIPSEVFNNIGFMKEDLFIDSVDSEWCWRARARGYEIIGCADVVIEHCLGGKIATWWRYSHDVRSTNQGLLYKFVTAFTCL